MEEKIAGDNIYPGCLVALRKWGNMVIPRRVALLDAKGWKPGAPSQSKQLSWNDVGVVISIFPNDKLQLGSRAWLIYFFPHLVIVEQADIRRVSLSWKEAQNLHADRAR